MILSIARGVWIDESEIEWRFVRASGPGGQKVNKVATAVQLRFDVAHAAGLGEKVRQRLIALAGRRMTTEGILLIDARRFRTQERNRQDALERLEALVQSAARAPTPRKRTKPSRAAKQRRMDAKSRRAGVKKLRRPVDRQD